ncbi:MAG: head-tail adaptor protein [Firmicutes bacterium]|nr:head-tail adaptor protein [Bacillota bacterium]
MSKAANAGELRTPVYFKRIERTTNEEGFSVEDEVNIFGEGVCSWVKWVNAHGSEVFTAMQLTLREPATLTVRYSPQINEKLLVYKGVDPAPFEVISIDNVEEKNVWLEIKVQRKVAAR